jgi:sterol 3beta-glucosyltransferase
VLNSTSDTDDSSVGGEKNSKTTLEAATARKTRIVCIAFGSRGDVQPMCLLARALMARGHSVTFITSGEYHSLARAVGVRASIIDVDFESDIRFHRFNEIFYDQSLPLGRKIGVLRDIARSIEDKVQDLLMHSLRMLRYFDLVVFNPFAFFAGQIAQELNIASVRIFNQPLLPTRHMNLAILGGGDMGPVVNRLSYETMRAVALLFSRPFRRFRAASGVGRRLRGSINPLTADLDFAAQLAAYSPHISPDPGDYPVSPTATGFWFHDPDPGETLPPDIMKFLAGGAPPIYIGFGSMVWGAQRNTEVVTKALSLWGGRAIVATGAGGLKPTMASPEIMVVPSVKHALLFPHLAGAVHHGGAGTTAQALRCGLPTAILPVLGDQHYWGSRLAALGAGPAPAPLRKIEPEDLAARFAGLADNPGYRTAAGDLADILACEPGLPAAVARVEECLAGATERWKLKPRAVRNRSEKTLARS